MKIYGKKITDSDGAREPVNRAGYPCGRKIFTFLKGMANRIPLAFTVIFATFLILPCMVEAAPDRAQVQRAGPSAASAQSGPRDHGPGPRSTPNDSHSQAAPGTVDKNGMGVQTVINIEWESYDTSGAVCNTFSDQKNNTVYMKGTGFTVNDEYKVAYYDGNARLIQVNTVYPESGAINSYCKFSDYPKAATGTWTAIVCTSNTFESTSKSVPRTLVEAKSMPGYIISDTFTVETGAIPELTSILGAVGICGFCGLTYALFRKKRYACGIA